jgi:hypothetical protein
MGKKTSLLASDNPFNWLPNKDSNSQAKGMVSKPDIG